MVKVSVINVQRKWELDVHHGKGITITFRLVMSDLFRTYVLLQLL